MRNIVIEVSDVWKACAGHGECPTRQAATWKLRGVNLKIAEGDFVAILGGTGEGKSMLLRIMAFAEKPDRGEVRFQGRVVGKWGDAELETMRAERVWLIKGAVPDGRLCAACAGCNPGTDASGDRPIVGAGSRKQSLAAILLDEPLTADDLAEGGVAQKLFDSIREVRGSGVAVVLATSEPLVAARADIIYKLRDDGVLVSLTHWAG